MKIAAYWENSPPSNDYRKLEKYVISGKTGEKIDLLSDVPEEYSVLFVPYSSDCYGEAVLEARNRGCIIIGDITTINGIITLLHEVGHIISYEMCENKENFFPSGSEFANSKEGLEKKLREERKAWAYALRKLKTLFNEKTFPKSVVLKTIHSVNLHSHSEILRERGRK